MNFDIFLVGVGGQGVLTIAEIITEAAFLDNIPVNYFPTEGMAQRGGFVKAQVRIGSQFVGPNLPEKGSDLVISMEVSESFKAVKYVKPGGDFVVWGHKWFPAAVMLGKAQYPNLDQLRTQVTEAQATYTYINPDQLPLFNNVAVAENIFTLGVTCKNSKLNKMLKLETIRNAIGAKWPKDAERNLYAYNAGIEFTSGARA